MLSALAPARRRLVVAMVAAAVAAALVGAAIAIRSGGGRTSHAVAQNVPGPVLLVPGYGGSVTSLGSLATALRATGKDVGIVALPDGAVGDLIAQATALGDAADAALARTGASSVDVVGYSAGGVVARIWAQEGKGAGQARRIVTLGSPHHGTQLAELGTLVAGECPLACQQLASGSELLRRLDGAGLPSGPHFVSIWTTKDDVVVPPDSARLDGAVDVAVQSVCAGDGVRHGELPSDVVVQGLVAEALGSGAVPSWGSADCARLSS